MTANEIALTAVKALDKAIHAYIDSGFLDSLNMGELSEVVEPTINAVKAQNTVNPAGQVGSQPVPKGQEFTYAVRAQGRLQSEEEFGEIVLRANTDGSIVRVKDVARIELGAPAAAAKQESRQN